MASSKCGAGPAVQLSELLAGTLRMLWTRRGLARAIVDDDETIDVSVVARPPESMICSKRAKYVVRSVHRVLVRISPRISRKALDESRTYESAQPGRSIRIGSVDSAKLGKSAIEVGNLQFRNSAAHPAGVADNHVRRNENEKRVPCQCTTGTPSYGARRSTTRCHREEEKSATGVACHAEKNHNVSRSLTRLTIA